MGRAVVGVVAVVVGGVLAAWWASGSDAFPGVGDDPQPQMQLVVGEPLHLGLGVVPAAPVTLVDVRPRVHGDVQVDYEVTVCSPGPHGVAGAFGGELAEVCSDAEAPQGVRYGGDLGRHVTVTLVATEPGEVTIDGYDVTYRAGMRTRSQHVGASQPLIAAAGAGS